MSRHRPALALCASLTMGCASMKYSTRGVESLSADPTVAPMVVPQLLDARQAGAPSPASVIPRNPKRAVKQREEDFVLLRESVSRHVVVAGLAEAQAVMPAAPQTADDVERILRDAGDDEVLFLRLEGAGTHGKLNGGVAGTVVLSQILLPVGGVGILPMVIVSSLPVNKESGETRMEAIVVHGGTREVLAHVRGASQLRNDRVSYWAFNPDGELAELTRAAVQDTLEAVAEARRRGYPDRTTVPDLPALVLTGHRPSRQLTGLYSEALVAASERVRAGANLMEVDPGGVDSSAVDLVVKHKPCGFTTRVGSHWAVLRRMPGMPSPSPWAIERHMVPGGQLVVTAHCTPLSFDLGTWHERAREQAPSGWSDYHELGAGMMQLDGGEVAWTSRRGVELNGTVPVYQYELLFDRGGLGLVITAIVEEERLEDFLPEIRAHLDSIELR